MVVTSESCVTKTCRPGRSPARANRCCTRNRAAGAGSAIPGSGWSCDTRCSMTLSCPRSHPVRPSAILIEYIHTGVSDQPVLDDRNVPRASGTDRGPGADRLGGLDATGQRAGVQGLETASKEGSEFAPKGGARRGNWKRVPDPPGRKPVTDRVTEEHGHGLARRRLCHPACHGRGNAPVDAAHRATPTTIEGRAVIRRTPSKANPASPRSAAYSAAVRSLPPVAISRCRSHKLPATPFSGITISTTNNCPAGR